MEELERKIDELESRINRAKAFIEILNLQAKFNYYLEANELENLIELFAQKDDNVSCEVFDSGVYKGLDKVKEFLTARHNIQSARGYMGNLMLKTPHVRVSQDGKFATGTWHAFGANSLYASPYPCDQEKLTATWFMGKFSNKYIFEDGGWKILSLCLMPHFCTPFDQGWIKQSDCYRFAPPPSTCTPTEENATIYTYHPHGDIEEFLGRLPEPE